MVGLAVCILWAVKRYGTAQYEKGAADEQVQVTKDLEKNVRLRYAAAIKELDTARMQLQQDQTALQTQKGVIQADRTNFNNIVSSKLDAINNATKGSMQDASKTPDSDLNFLARQWIARLSARIQ